MKHSIRSRNHTITGLVDAVLQHAGRQHAQSCVDENEPWSATDLHVGMAAARPSQEELQFCLAAAQQPRAAAGTPTRDFLEGGLTPWLIHLRGQSARRASATARSARWGATAATRSASGPPDARTPSPSCTPYAWATAVRCVRRALLAVSSLLGCWNQP